MKNQNGNDVFSRRFARHEDELKWLYMELYHNDAAACSAACCCTCGRSGRKACGKWT